MKKYILTNKYFEEEFNVVSELYFNTLEETNKTINTLIIVWNDHNYFNRQWTKEDFEILECE